MSALIGFLGIMRVVAWVYLCAMFLAATGLTIFHRPSREAAAEETEPMQEKRAA